MEDRFVSPNKVFTENYTQLQMLTLLLIPSMNLLRIYAPYIKSTYWQGDIQRDLARVILSHYFRYKKVITIPILRESVLRFIYGTQKDKLREAYLNTIQQIKDLSFDPYGEHQYFCDLFKNHIRLIEIEQKALSILDNIDKRRGIDIIENSVADISKLPTDITDQGLNFFNIDELPNSNENCIPTLFPKLDSALHGGLGRGEIGCVVADSSMGKSSVLNRLGLAAVFSGFNVVHYTFELSASKIAQRYLKALTGQPEVFESDSIGFIKSSIRNRMLELKSMFNGNLFLMDFPMRTETKKLESHLNGLVASGIIPDLIITDYCDLMKPNFVNKNASEWSFYGDIVLDLIDLGKRYNCGNWTASQTNRTAAGKRVVTKAHMSKSYDKVGHSDIIMTLCQTAAEEKQKIMRFFLDKNRDGEKHVTVHVEFEPETMRIAELIGTPEILDNEEEE